MLTFFLVLFILNQKSLVTSLNSHSNVYFRTRFGFVRLSFSHFLNINSLFSLAFDCDLNEAFFLEPILPGESSALVAFTREDKRVLDAFLPHFYLFISFILYSIFRDERVRENNEKRGFIFSRNDNSHESTLAVDLLR